MKSPETSPSPLSFPKSERLHYPSLVKLLYEKGSRGYVHPLRLTWRFVEQESLPEEIRGECLQVMVTIPKRGFKRAVKRVRLRRLVKEAWRLQRVPLRERIRSERPGWSLHVSIVYIGKEVLPYSKISAKVASALNLLAAKNLDKPEGGGDIQV